MSNLLEIKVDGIDSISAKINPILSPEGTRDLLDQAAALLLHNMLQRFLQQVDPDGVPWEPLKKQTQKEHDASGGGGILFASGKLLHSLQVYQVDSMSRAIGTDVPYGKYHQFGTVTLPKRTFLGFSASDTQTVQDLLLRTIQKAMVGNGN